MNSLFYLERTGRNILHRSESALFKRKNQTEVSVILQRNLNPAFLNLLITKFKGLDVQSSEISETLNTVAELHENCNFILGYNIILWIVFYNFLCILMQYEHFNCVSQTLYMSNPKVLGSDPAIPSAQASHCGPNLDPHLKMATM